MSSSGNDVAFTFHITATDAAIRRLLADLRARLIAAEIAADTCGTVEIVLAEALNNIAEHAYPAGAPGPLTLSARRAGGALAFTLTDRGRPLPGDAIPAGRLPDASGALDTLPEGGFGWFLIRSLTSGISYSRQGGRNRLRLSVPI